MITAQSLHTIAVEYEEDENDGDDGSADHEDGRPGRRKYERAARAVAVYVGDATSGDPDRGSFVAWSLKEARGIRIMLPVSVSAVVRPDGGPDHLDVDRNVLHLALLDEPRPAGRVVRHLYITYGRHPDAYKIPVDVIRNRRRRTNEDRPELQLTKCGATGGNRCLINAGRKPVGPDGRPLVPLDSAYGHLWYYRDGASAGAAGLYVWDSRRPFHAEHFRRIGGDRGTPSVRDDECACEPDKETGGGDGGSRRQRSVTITLRRKSGGRTDGRRAGNSGRVGAADGVDDDENDRDDGDDGDEDGAGKCETRAESNKTAATGRQRSQAKGTWAGCMKITSVDYSSSDPTVGDAGAGGYGTLWTLNTNIRDWVRGQTGRFGPVALLCPFRSQ